MEKNSVCDFQSLYHRRKTFEEYVQPLVLLCHFMINKIKHLAYLLGSSEKELQEIIYNIDQYYHCTLQPKKKYGGFQYDSKENIKYRNLCISSYPLKEIQRRINSILQQIELPSYAFGSVKGKSNLLNAKQHIANKYFFLVDLKDFFPNITHNQVFRMFRLNKFSPSVSRVLTQLTTYRGSLPQGPPSSPHIANLVFVETGNKLEKTIKDYNICFTSFLDDLTFSSKNDFKFITRALLQILKTGGFVLNHKKISYKTARPEVTGAIIHSHKLHAPKTMKDRAKENPFVAAYIKRLQL